MDIKKVHRISGITISIFIGMHLFNHFMSVFGTEVHIELMNTLRPIYRNIISETVLLMTVFIQIISGLKLFFRRRKSADGYYQNLQIWTGLYLAFFLLIHVGAVMVGRFFLHLDTNFYFGVAGLNTFPFNLFFIPYYALAIFSFFGHIAAIHNQKMNSKILGFTVEHQSKIILIIGIVTIVIIFYGLTNGFKGVEIPDNYNILIGK